MDVSRHAVRCVFGCSQVAHTSETGTGPTNRPPPAVSCDEYNFIIFVRNGLGVCDSHSVFNCHRTKAKDSVSTQISRRRAPPATLHTLRHTNARKVGVARHQSSTGKLTNRGVETRNSATQFGWHEWLSSAAKGYNATAMRACSIASIPAPALAPTPLGEALAAPVTSPSDDVNQ